MTPQEAIEIIKIAIAEVEWNYPMNYAIAFEMAIEALEKQIPKKPDYEGDGYDENGILIYDRAICPNCENDDFEYDINNWGCKFCPDCGQALDWSEVK